MLTDVLAYLLVPAGVVFAAVAGELLPEIMHGAMPVPVIVGFTLGVALMLAIKWFADRNEAAESEAKSGLVVIIGVDIAIDGLLVGVSFSAGTKAGVLVTLALSLEVLFLALSTAATQIGDGVSRAKVAATAFAFAIVLVAAAVAGTVSLNSLSPAMLEGVLAFGVAALLYLVTEELLVEAHEVEETPLTTATFFAGFLVILLIEMAI